VVRRILLPAACLALLPADGAQSRLWWSGPQVTLLGSPSNDGSALSFVDPDSGLLAIRNLPAGTWKPILAGSGGTHEFAHFSVFSRTGRAVAYAWFNNDGFYELRVVSAAGGASPVVAYRNPQVRFVQPCAWTPDGRQILTLLFRRDNISQIALIPADGGTPRVLRSLNWVYPKRMDLSPDGAWVVYDNFADERGPERTIFLLSSDGSEERRLVEMPGSFLFPLWSPGGRRVYFAGDRGGATGLWAVDVTEGHPRGAPFRVAGGLGRFLPMGITAGNDYFYGVRTGSLDLFLLPLSGSQPQARALPTRFPSRNQSPAWSHDGKRIAYVSRRDTENFGEDARALVVQDLATGVEREIPARLAHVERLAWSPDDQALLISGSDGKGRSGLFLVRADTGVASPVAAEHDAPFRGFEAVWPSASQTVYYLRSDELRAHSLVDGRETVVLRAAGMRHLAVNPAGDTLAVGIGGNAIRLTPLRSASPARLIPFPGLTALAWGSELLAGREGELWSVPAGGEGVPRPIARVPQLLPVLAIGPGGREICFAAGSEQSEVRSLRLP
jgi:Tol biopolymer transport system component